MELIFFYVDSRQTHAVVSSQMDPVKMITRLGIEDREFVDPKEGTDDCYLFTYMYGWSCFL